MDRKEKIYWLTGLVAFTLIFIQFNPLLRQNKDFVTEIQSLGTINQLLLNVDCNLFIIQGDEQRMVYEGPENLVKMITISISDGCVTVDDKKGYIMKKLNSLFVHPGKNIVNIYMIVKNPDQIEITSNLHSDGTHWMGIEGLKAAVHVFAPKIRTKKNFTYNV